MAGAAYGIERTFDGLANVLLRGQGLIEVDRDALPCAATATAASCCCCCGRCEATTTSASSTRRGRTAAHQTASNAAV